MLLHVSPCHEAERARDDREKDHRLDRVQWSVTSLCSQVGQERRRQDRPAPRGIACQLKVAVPSQQRSLYHEEEREQDRGTEHQNRVAAELDPVSLTNRHDDGPEKAGSEPDTSATCNLLAQRQPGQGCREDRAGVHEQAGTSGGDGSLSGVEEALVAGHPGQPAGNDPREIPGLWKAHPPEDGNEARQHHGRDQKTAGCELTWPEAACSDSDRDERRGPGEDSRCCSRCQAPIATHLIRLAQLA